MKIMIIQPWIRQGGAELISVYLAYELENQGHEASIVCLYVDIEGMPHVADRVRYIVPSPWISQWLSSSRIAFLLLGPWILLKLVRDNASKFDVLNPHNFPSMWVAILVSMVKKVPVIWTCNEPPTRVALQDIVQIGLGDFIGWLLACSPIDRWFARKVEIIHVLSHRAKSQVQERYGRNSCVVRSGVDCELFAHTPDHQIVQEHNLENKFVLLTVGKLHPQKNHVMLIDALYNILPRIPNAVLLIVGEGPIRGNLEDYVKHSGLSDHVKLLGFVDSNYLAGLYRFCNVNLFSGINQSWGLTPFEALCAERVSIVPTDCGAAEFLAEHSIGVVAEPTPEEFGRYIWEIYQNPDHYQEIARRGNAYVKKYLSHPTFTEGIIDLAKRALKHRASGLKEKELTEVRWEKGT